jgi:hypothetical protein
MKTLRRVLTTTAVALAATAAVAPFANANTIQIQYQIGAGPVTTCSATAPGPVDCSDVAGPPLHIVGLDANSNNPGTPGIAVTTSSSVDVINNSTSAQTLYVEVSVDGFTAPVGFNATLLSHIGGTVITGGAADLLSFESCIDTTNTRASVSNLSASATCPAGTLASGISAPSIAATGSFQNDKSNTRATLAGPYSIDQSMVLTLAAGAEVNFSASSSVTASTVPEPVTMALVGGGLIALGIIRKRYNR